MSEKRKSASPAATVEAESASRANNQESSTHNSSIPCPEVKFNEILSLIPFGRDSAIHLQDLVKLSGMYERDVRKTIEHARRDGAFILSDDFGYWRTDLSTEQDTAEALRWIRRESRRIHALERRLQPLQQRIDGSDGFLMRE